MKRPTRVGACAVAVMAAASALVPALASPASAAQSAACAKLTIPPIGAAGKVVSTYAQCTPAALKAGGTSTGKKATNGPQKGKTIITIVWKAGKGTTKATLAYAPLATRGKCAAGTARIKITGKVLSATGAAKKVIKVNEPVTASICALTSGPNLGKSSLEPGTKFKL